MSFLCNVVHGLPAGNYTIKNMKKELTKHGNMLVINKLGVLIIGGPKIGKSELSLALVDRGHQLVSDDAISISSAQGKLIATSPAMVSDYLLIDSIGVINVRKLFGANATIHSHPLELIVELMPNAMMPPAKDPLRPLMQKIKIFDITITKYIFPIFTGDSLALKIETLVKNYQLVLNGFNAAKEFNARQHQLINKKKSCK